MTVGLGSTTRSAATSRAGATHRAGAAHRDAAKQTAAGEAASPAVGPSVIDPAGVEAALDGTDTEPTIDVTANEGASGGSGPIGFANPSDESSGADSGHSRGPDTGGLLSGEFEPIAVGLVEDRFEEEADAWAQAAGSGFATAAGSGRPSPPSRRGSTARRNWLTADTPSGAELLGLLNRPSNDQRLPGPILQPIADGLRADLSEVRVRTGPEARRATRLLGTNAFTYGPTIWLAGPALLDDRRLMTHEVTHVLQQRGGHVAIQRDSGADPDLEPLSETDGSYPPMPTVAYLGLSAIRLTLPTPNRPLPAGRTDEEHAAAIYAKKLLGERYDRQHSRTFVEANPSTRFSNSSVSFYPGFLMSTPVAYDMVRHLYRRIEPSRARPPWEVLDIPRARVELLYVSWFNDEVAAALRRLNNPNQNWPRWYNQSIARHHLSLLAADMQRHALRLKTVVDVDWTTAPAEFSEVAETVFGPLHPDVMVVDRIRQQAELYDDPDFRRFWQLPRDGSDGPAEDANPRADDTVRLLQFVRTQPGLHDAILNGGAVRGVRQDVRTEMWTRFRRRHRRQSAGEAGEAFEFSNSLGPLNAPPFPAVLRHVPPLDRAVGWEASISQTHLFSMDVDLTAPAAWGHAFGLFQYNFEVLEIPPSEVARAVAQARNEDQNGESTQEQQLDGLLERAENEDLGTGTSANEMGATGHNLAREIDYLEADAETIMDAVTDNLGPTTIGLTVAALLGGIPVGVAATSLAGVAALLRLGGTLIRSFISELSNDRNEESLSFRDLGTGLYLVRGVMEQQLDDAAEVRRHPTVAVTPIWIRNQSDLGRRAMNRTVESSQRVRTEIQTLEGILASLSEGTGELTEEERADNERIRQLVQQRIDRLRNTTSTDAGDRLQQLLDDHNRALAQDGLTEFQKERLNDRVTMLTRLTQRRRERIGSGPPGEILTAVFVPDEGPTMQPLIEVFNDGASRRGRSVTYTAYELSSGRDASGEGTGTHPDDAAVRRRDAIENALEALFERYNAFGRGHLRVVVPDVPGGRDRQVLTLRIEADLTSIGMRTVEDVTGAIALAALAAAPFTGGASLVLMVPSGLIGATPAAYRLIDRAGSDTLYFDNIETWLDMIDVLGAASGPLGRVASRGTRSTSRALRVVGYTGRGVAVIGAGADNFGLVLVNLHTINQIREILNGPGTDSQKRASIIMLLGSLLQANGMAVAPRLMSHAQSMGLPDPNQAGRAGQADARTADPATRRDGSGEAEAGTARPTPPPLVDAPNLATELPADLARNLTIRREATGDSRSVRVRFETDIFGLVRNIHIEAGARATAADVTAHRSTLRALRRYQGLGGLVRVALQRAERLVGRRGDPPTDSLAFEALLELRKLPDVIALRNRELAAAIEHNSPTQRDIEADIANLRRQVEFYGDQLATGYDTPGRGYVAALDQPAFDRMKRQVRDAIAHPAGQNNRQRAEWNARYMRALDAVVEQLESRPGGLSDRDRAMIVNFLRGTSRPDNRTLRRSHLIQRLRTLRRLANLLTSGNQPPRRDRRARTLRRFQSDLASAYEAGTTAGRDPRRIPRTEQMDQRFSGRFREAAEALDALDGPTRDAMSDLEFGLADELAQQRLSRIETEMQAFGDSHFTPQEESGSFQPGTSLAELNDAVTQRNLASPDADPITVEEAPVSARADGHLAEGLDRSLSMVGLERYILSSGKLASDLFDAALRPVLRRLFGAYQRAHLVGPGFGSELFAGIWMAPDRFNLKAQNDGIERIARDARDFGWTVEASIQATGRRIRLPSTEGVVEVTVLTSITYELRYSTVGGEAGPVRRVRYDIGDPPDGNITMPVNDIPALGPDGLIPAELARLRAELAQAGESLTTRPNAEILSDEIPSDRRDPNDIGDLDAWISGLYVDPS